MSIPQVPNRAMHFDGTGYVDCENTYSSPEITVLMEVTHRIAGNEGVIIGNSDTTSNRGFEVQLDSDSNRIQFFINDNSAFKSSVGLAVGQTYRVACTYDGSSRKIYIDGVLRGTNTHVTGPMLASTATIVVGRRGWTSDKYLIADNKDIRILDRAVTAQEIADHYAAPTEHLLDTVLHLKGESVLDVAGGVDTVYDSSGNENHGIAVGGVSTVEDAEWSFANEVGYSDGTTAEGLVIPRDESTRDLPIILDVLGNPVLHLPSVAVPAIQPHQNTPQHLMMSGISVPFSR